MSKERSYSRCLPCFSKEWGYSQCLQCVGRKLWLSRCLPLLSRKWGYSRCLPCMSKERSYSRCLPGPASARSGATLNACAVRGPEAEVVLMPALLEPEVGLLSMPALREQGAELVANLLAVGTEPVTEPLAYPLCIVKHRLCSVAPPGPSIANPHHDKQRLFQCFVGWRFWQKGQLKGRSEDMAGAKRRDKSRAREKKDKTYLIFISSPREAVRLHASASGLDARPVTREQLVALRRADRHRAPLVGRANVVEPPPTVG
jgi:hypothetical protein